MVEAQVQYAAGVFLGLGLQFPLQMGVSKNRDTSKWMVYNGKPY